jgi:uncharacterized membrane protein YjgN (DUF898 family)
LAYAWLAGTSGSRFQSAGCGAAVAIIRILIIAGFPLIDLSIAAAGLSLTLAGHVLAHVALVLLTLRAAISAHLVCIVTLLPGVRFGHAVAAAFGDALIHLGHANKSFLGLTLHAAVSRGSISIITGFACINCFISTALGDVPRKDRHLALGSLSNVSFQRYF